MYCIMYSVIPFYHTDCTCRLFDEKHLQVLIHREGNQNLF